MAKKAINSIEFATCENSGCKNKFKPRANRRSCSTKCRKALSRASVPVVDPVVETQTHAANVYMNSKDKDCSMAYETSGRLAHTYYNLPPEWRENYVRKIMEVGASKGDGLRYRRAMTAPKLLKPRKDKDDVFYLGERLNYHTFAQIASRYCLKVVGIPIQEFMKNPRNLKDYPLVHDMTPFDVPCFTKQTPTARTEEEIRALMTGRSPLSVELASKTFGLWPEQPEQLAA